MIQVEYKLKIGSDEFIIKAEATNEKEFFETMSFYTSLPKVGPGGETDLKLVYRNVKGYTFYSLVSEEAKMEFQLGQYKEGGGLYAKTWEPLYKKDGEESDEREEKTSSSRFSKSEKKESKGVDFSKRTAPKEKVQEPAEKSVENEEEQQEEPPKEESKQATAPAASGGKSKMADLMAKYGGAKSGASTSSNVRR